MQESQVDIVQSPSVDFEPYLTTVLRYLTEHYPQLIEFTKTAIGFIIGISIPISLLLFLLIIYTVERLKALRIREEHEVYGIKIDLYGTGKTEKTEGNPEIAKKWDMALKHVESQNSNDWRQAIIEADIILGEVLKGLGYKGESIGEQLKRATKAEFKTLDEAWEAHKVRNELAHAGSDYNFSQYDARRVIQLYRKVFEEFFHI